MDYYYVINYFCYRILYIKTRPNDLMNKPQTQTVQCYKDSSIKDLVMLPKLNPAQLTTHTTL